MKLKHTLLITLLACGLNATYFSALGVAGGGASTQVSETREPGVFPFLAIAHLKNAIKLHGLKGNLVLAELTSKLNLQAITALSIPEQNIVSKEIMTLTANIQNKDTGPAYIAEIKNQPGDFLSHFWDKLGPKTQLYLADKLPSYWFKKGPVTLDIAAVDAYSTNSAQLEAGIDKAITNIETSLADPTYNNNEDADTLRTLVRALKSPTIEGKESPLAAMAGKTAAQRALSINLLTLESQASMKDSGALTKFSDTWLSGLKISLNTAGDSSGFSDDIQTVQVEGLEMKATRLTAILGHELGNVQRLETLKAIAVALDTGADGKKSPIIIAVEQNKTAFLSGQLETLVKLAEDAAANKGGGIDALAGATSTFTENFNSEFKGDNVAIDLQGNIGPPVVDDESSSTGVDSWGGSSSGSVEEGQPIEPIIEQGGEE